MSSPEISVIIPAYNQGHYLGEAIQSVLNQTCKDFELVIVDDGSSDNTSNVVGLFSDPRIRYIYEENKGLSGARNTGIINSTAPYLAFLDADDLLLPDSLTLHLDIRRSQPSVGISVGGWGFIDSQGCPLLHNVLPPASLNSTSLLTGNSFPVHSVLLSRTWLDREGLFDESLHACEDWDLWLRIVRAGVQICSLDRVVCLYRMHTGQMTKQVERMRTAMLAVLDKTFSLPDLPVSWRAMRNKAYAAAYVKAAARAYHAAALVDAKRDLAEAVRLDPSLLDDEARNLANQLAGWANAPMVKDPLNYLEKVYKNLPDNLSLLRQHRHRELARAAMQLAFESYGQGNLSTARFFTLRALYHEPGWLKNRGVLSILIRSYFYFRV